tara:strand:+ start:979 stop:1218 length:240 start_codon:yes stop_codon:yes gene_type:complete
MTLSDHEKNQLRDRDQKYLKEMKKKMYGLKICLIVNDKKEILDIPLTEMEYNLIERSDYDRKNMIVENIIRQMELNERL